MVRSRLVLSLLLCLLVLTACSRQTEEATFWDPFLGDPQAGREAIQTYGCPACHTIPGIAQANSMVGPPLTSWAGRSYIAGQLPNQPDNLVRWIIDPQSIEPGTAMPDMNVSEADARDIAAYLFTLGDGAQLAGRTTVDQPVPFSHQHHVDGLGLDCRYCHTSVTRSTFAGMPSTRTCMTCHSQVWTDSPLLAPVRVSQGQDIPIPWRRIYDLPDSVHFDHAAHLRSGVGCDTCHGRVDQMHVTEAAVSMTMEWCLDCHREPQQYLRPPDEVFNLSWQRPDNQRALGAALMDQYQIPAEILTDCSLCHY